MTDRKSRGATTPTTPSVTNSGAWSESATRVLRERYLWKNDTGATIETPDEMCWRVARAIASAEATNSAKSPEEIEAVAADYAEMMLSRRFMPNSPTLMNAGKGNNLQLSACFVLPVEDSLAGIFESVKQAAIVHQSGGGCIAGDAHIFTTFCGVESIAVLYDRVKATGKNEEIYDDHAIIDVTDLHIKTMALNPNDGSYEQAPLTHLWRYDVPLEDQIRVHGANGLEVTTSRWHPFMVFDGKELVERRADELHVGDILPTPNASVRERWPHQDYKTVAGVLLDEDIAWFLGYYLGDGNLGWAKVPESEPRREKLRWRLFDGRTASLEYARDILARRFAVHVQMQQDGRGLYTIATTNAGFIAQFQNLLGVFPGPKLELPFPEMIAKSPLSVVGAFLAGLVDSDGHVEAERDRVSITMQTQELMERVHTLCSLLGLAPAIRRREPVGKGRTPVYEVKLAAEPRIADLRDLIGPYLKDELKSQRLADIIHEPDHSTGMRLPLPFSAIEDILQSVGVATETTPIHRQALTIGNETFWLHNWKQGKGAGLDLLSRLIPTLRQLADAQYHPRLDVLERLMQGATTVASIEQPTEKIMFYDFTVADYNTYLAGKHGLTAIHNTGFSFSRLRPEGSHVASTHGVASGPVSFMRIFDQATDAVKQGGSRRGANMGILRVDHPDIEQFIDCKLSGGITNFNISVAITDVFMDALLHNTDYELIDPHTNKVVGMKSARALMDRIISAAWSSGDPGLVFLDRANRSPANPTPELEMLEATNPCVVGSTLLATSKGLQRMDTLFASGEVLSVATDARSLIRTANGRDAVKGDVAFHTAVPVFQTGQQVPVWRLITSHGIEITATPSHRFLTVDGFKRLDELEFGDELLLQSAEGAWPTDEKLPEVVYGIRSESRIKAKIERGEAQPPVAWTHELGEMLGYVLGDGYIRRGETADIMGIAIALEDVAIKDLIHSRIKQWFGADGTVTERQGHYQTQFVGTPATFFRELGLTTDRAPDKRVPQSVFAAPRQAVAGFLRGLFTADGSVQIGAVEKGTCSVRLATSSKGLAQDVQQLLLHFGIVSVIRLRREKGIRLLPNAQREPAEYETQAQYEVIIDKSNRDRFAGVIGFMQERKQHLLTDWIIAKKRTSNQENFITKVALIEDAGTADVFDTTEPVTHSIIVNGLVTHQCGEQWLGPFDACNLGSINLGLFVEDGIIDWESLGKTVHSCVRFLDDVIDINPYPLQQIHDKVHANRRIGLGVMGWADMLFKLGTRYDSAEAVALGERVMRFVSDEADKASTVLAEDRGVFPSWPHSIYKDGLRLRNSNRTTVAPTGTISIIADCSSGIEPIFALAFQHRVKQPDGTYRVLDFVNPIFIDILRASDIENQDEVIAFAREHGSLHGHPAQNHPALAAFVTAHEIAPEWHIQMQAAFQKGVNSSISKTINLPNDATLADVEQAYLQAWNLGCLGITVFRDGCKGEQVLNVGVKKEAQPVPATVEAPGVVAPPAVTVAPAVSIAPTIAVAPTVMVAPAPVPVVATPARSSYYTNGVKARPDVVHGYTRQVRAPEGKVSVTLNSDDDGLLEVFVTIGKAGSDVAALAEALGRLISRQLRIESPISQNERARDIADQLHSIGGSTSIGFGMDRVRSLPDAVARAISMHLEEEERKAEGGTTTASVDEHVSTPTQANGSGAPLASFGEVQHYAVIGNLCPQCGCNTLVYAEGCKKCMACGHSEC